MSGQHGPDDAGAVLRHPHPSGVDAPRVVLHGDLDLGGCERWTAALHEAADALGDGEDLVVDARDVPFADCTGLRLLEDAAARAGGRLVVRAPSRAVTRVLAATGGTTALLVEASEDDGGGSAGALVLGFRAGRRADAVEVLPRRGRGSAGPGCARADGAGSDGARAVRAACAQLTAWDDALGDRGPRRVEVRLAEEEVRHAGTPGRVRVALAEHGLDPARLVLLVDAPSGDVPASLRSAVERLRELGCGVRAVDGSPLP